MFLCRDQSFLKTQANKMSLSVSKAKHTKKSEYANGTDFVEVIPTSLPDIPVAEQWIIEPCFMPEKFELFANQIRSFEVRTDDIWVICYPNTGTLFLQEMVWLLGNDLDYKRSQTLMMNARYNFLELETLMSIDLPLSGGVLQSIKNSPSPRHIKSHLPVGLLPRQLFTVKPKIVYCARNPRDTAVSYYHHYRIMQGYQGTLDDFVEAFISEKVLFSPFHSHILNFWSMRNEKNILFIHYEEMVTKMLKVITETSEFLGMDYTKEQLLGLEANLTKKRKCIIEGNCIQNSNNKTDKYRYRII